MVIPSIVIIATRADASPPTPLNRATSCGIWIILTLYAQIRPITEPIAIHGYNTHLSNIWYWTSVMIIAASIHKPLKALPITDVLTLLIRYIPTRTPTAKTATRV